MRGFGPENAKSRPAQVKPGGVDWFETDGLVKGLSGRADLKSESPWERRVELGK